MKTFVLLWLASGANSEVSRTDARSAEGAAIMFGLDSTYQKQENGGAWCVAEVFSCLP